MSKFMKALSLLLVVAVTAGVAISGTLAYLTKDAGDEQNVFSVGNIDVSLDEEVGIYGEGGEVKETESGAEYTDIMPGDYLKKEVTVTNNGKTDAYVAVTVTVNNGNKITAAIDDYYEKKLGKSDKTDEYIYNMYNNIFDGWGMNYYHNNEYGYDARNTITQSDSHNTDWPEHALKVDYAETMNDYWLYSKGNWFKTETEKVHDYWTDSAQVNGDFSLGYYTKNLEAGKETYTMIYTYYLYLPAGESSTLFEGLNVPAEFNADQLAMFDGLEINVEAKAIQADNMAVADQYKDDENGKAKTAFAILHDDIEVPDYSNKPIGKVTYGLVSADRIWGEGYGNAKESFVVKIYSGDTYMGETSLNNVDGIIDGSVENVTWSIKLNGESTDYWTMKWENVPTINMQPTNVELWIDGEKVDEAVVYLNSSGDLIKPAVGVVITADGTIVRYVFNGDSTAAEAGQTYVPFISTADELAAALTGPDKNISVILLNDIDLPISSLGSQTSGSGEYKLGGADTENITINLNGHELNITTGYWSAIGAKNDNATITILNGSMTSTGNSATTWNANDIRLCNCNYVIENVTFNKEVALDNAGKTTTMKNVTINGTGDYYALWITAEGQNVTIDGLTVNTTGRGIKIDEQYVENPAKVTLSVSNSTFTTAKKAAIMVKSTAGANITVSDIDITGVAADTTNAVWVDSDASQYAGLVTVTGGSVINEE